MTGDKVRLQYEDYPYPSRDPADEAKRLVEGSPSHLLEVDHYLFAGAADFAGGFRVLVAGGGTGDAAIMLAQQLADRGEGGRVTYLDLAEKTTAIARARAEARGLENIDFVTGSLLEVAKLTPEPFDYIDCCGVLHHLPEPEAGLAALASVLKPGGGLGIMLYGEYGRLGVYPLQEMLRMIGEDLPLPERIGQARRLIDALPPTNGFVLNRNLGDHKRGDAELVDLLLHPQDRAYRVEQVYELVGSVPGLRLVTFLEPLFYRPESYLKDEALLAALAPLSRPQREAFAEKLAGNRKTHLFYLTSRSDDDPSVAPLDDPSVVPRLRHDDGAEMAKGLSRVGTLKLQQQGIGFSWRLPEAAAPLLGAIDGKRSLSEIHAEMKKGNRTLNWTRFVELYAPLYELFNGLNLLFHAYPKERR